MIIQLVEKVINAVDQDMYVILVQTIASVMVGAMPQHGKIIK
jgi:hypothetical protein